VAGPGDGGLAKEKGGGLADEVGVVLGAPAGAFEGLRGRGHGLSWQELGGRAPPTSGGKPGGSAGESPSTSGGGATGGMEMWL
jgi:hypothetical protein